MALCYLYWLGMGVRGSAISTAKARRKRTTSVKPGISWKTSCLRAFVVNVLLRQQPFQKTIAAGTRERSVERCLPGFPDRPPDVKPAATTSSIGNVKASSQPDSRTGTIGGRDGGVPGRAGDRGENDAGGHGVASIRGWSHQSAKYQHVGKPVCAVTKREPLKLKTTRNAIGA